jgi:hypothetical protein
LGNAEKSRWWPFSSRKSKNAVFDFLHFQPLIAIENAGPSSARLGKRIKSDVAYPEFVAVAVAVAVASVVVLFPLMTER